MSSQSSSKSKKLWGARFSKELDPSAKALSYSILTDSKLVLYDIKVNSAHVQSLEKAGILSKKESDSLLACLGAISDEFESGHWELLSENDEDIHSCVERLVTEKLGDLGKKMHTGKSRNDQVMTDIRLYLMDHIDDILHQLVILIHELVDLADANKDQIFPGFTHFQSAQPVLLAHHILAYVEMFTRDYQRFEACFNQVDCCPLGSGALAGNNYPIDREWVANELGFSSISQNSMDAVADRDFMIEFVSSSSILMVHLSRFCEELVLWNSPLIGFVSIGDDFTTGSSLMPQKKNPDMAELIRGKASRVSGHLTTLTQLTKALPLTYNRDLQEDKIPVFDTVETVSLSLSCFTNMIKTLVFQPDPINHALRHGYLNATELADYLVAKNIPFRQAHEFTGQLVSLAVAKGIQLNELTLDQFQSICSDIDDTIFNVLSLTTAIQKKSTIGGTSPSQVQYQIQRVRELFNDQ